MKARQILVRGASQHNLKHLHVSIPREAVTVVTGVSGSGKSSLAFDTLYAEAQRRFLETLSVNSRQSLGRMDRPRVDSIEGLPPAIAVDQRPLPGRARSTVGTVSEIQDLLRLLFAKVGEPHCPKCGKPIGGTTLHEIRDRIMALEGLRIHLYAPVLIEKPGTHRKLLHELLKAGYVRARIDGRLMELEESIGLSPELPHTIEVLVDRLLVKPEKKSRLSESLETASKLTGGILEVEPEGREPLWFTQYPLCLACGVELPPSSPRLFSFNDPQGACPECSGLGLENSQIECGACKGSRLNQTARSFKVGPFGLDELCRKPLEELGGVLAQVELGPGRQEVAQEILAGVQDRLRALCRLGLGYLSLQRGLDTLSTGEAQRLRLAAHMGSPLVGVLYVLDEPSIGLHPADQANLMKTVRDLSSAGNTVVMVEHDPATILGADWVVDLGPGAGELGGELLYSGPPQGILSCGESLTGAYLSGKKSIQTPLGRRPTQGPAIEVLGAVGHNLKNINVRFPLGCLTCVTGVSGSGKSTLVLDVLCREARRRLQGRAGRVWGASEVRGLEKLQAVVEVDQSPIGRTSRSNPATFLGLFRPIRELFSQLPEARLRGYGPERFSFNLKGGRCQTCMGEGTRSVDLLFLPNVYITCEACGGKRFSEETLEVRYKGLDIAQVLEMTAKEALVFFENIPRLVPGLRLLVEMGLGYLRLGQPAPSLSGGEAQRLKLARELARPGQGRTLYVLDEPTTGLHFEDVRRLLEVMERLLDAGNTIVVIEHNLEVIKCADHVIDLGPGGGPLGGNLVAQGSPEQIAQTPTSLTGGFLKELLDQAQACTAPGAPGRDCTKK